MHPPSRQAQDSCLLTIVDPTLGTKDSSVSREPNLLNGDDSERELILTLKVAGDWQVLHVALKASNCIAITKRDVNTVISDPIIEF